MINYDPRLLEKRYIFLMIIGKIIKSHSLIQSALNLLFNMLKTGVIFDNFWLNAEHFSSGHQYLQWCAVKILLCSFFSTFIKAKTFESKGLLNFKKMDLLLFTAKHYHTLISKLCSHFELCHLFFFTKIQWSPIFLFLNRISSPFW